MSEPEDVRRPATDTGSGGPSGLRNPPAAVRGVAAGSLVAEAVVLLLAVAPLVRIGGDRKGIAIGLVLALTVLCVLAAGLLRRRVGWWLGGAIQVVLLAGGLLHWSLALLGVLFGALWLYVLNVRRTVLGARRS